MKKRSRWFSAFLLLILILIPGAGQAMPGSAPSTRPARGEIDPQELERLLDDFLAEEMELTHTPGLVVTVVQNDAVLLSKGYGYADIEQEIPMTGQTQVRAGSVSKSITAAVVIQLVDSGVLNLDAPVSDYITDLDWEDGFGTASTIGQLLTHTSGYEDTLVASHSPDLASTESLAEVLHSDLPPRAFAPGMVASYSDWNYSLLGYAVEQVTGMPYAQAAEQILFTPLGMVRSTFTQPLPEPILSDLAVGYGWKYAKFSYEEVPHDFVRLSPGIALVTNGDDMGTFMRAVLSGQASNGDAFFSVQAQEHMLSRQYASHPLSRGSSYAFVENTIGGQRVMYKDGNGIGFASRMVLMPDEELGIFISTNHRNLGEGMWVTQATGTIRSVATLILDTFFPEAEQLVPEVAAFDAADLDLGRFAGEYQASHVSRRDFFKLEALFFPQTVRAEAGVLTIGSGSYTPVEPLVFQSQDNPSFFAVFIEDDEGEVAFLSLGGTGSYQKVPWYQVKSFTIALVGLVIISTLSMVIIWPIRKHGRWVVWAVSLLGLAFVAGVASMFLESVTDLLNYFKGVPWTTTVVFSLPWIIGILTLSLPVLLVMDWKDRLALGWSRLHWVVFMVTTALLVWLAWFWNLML